VVTTSIHSATPTNFIAGPLAVRRAAVIPWLLTHKQEFGSPSLQPSLRCQTHAFLPTRTTMWQRFC